MCPRTRVQTRQSAEEVEKAKTTINNIVRCHYNEVTHPDEVHGESANQNVVIVGERNDEDHAVPSVMMKLLEKLTDEEVDEMILVTEVDDSQCSEQIVDVPVPQIADRIVKVVTAFHGSESQNESLHRSSTCQDTHKVEENIVKDSQSRSISEPVNKS